MQKTRLLIRNSKDDYGNVEQEQFLLQLSRVRMRLDGSFVPVWRCPPMSAEGCFDLRNRGQPLLTEITVWPKRKNFRLTTGEHRSPVYRPETVDRIMVMGITERQLAARAGMTDLQFTAWARRWRDEAANIHYDGPIHKQLLQRGLRDNLMRGYVAGTLRQPGYGPIPETEQSDARHLQNSAAHHPQGIGAGGSVVRRQNGSSALPGTKSRVAVPAPDVQPPRERERYGSRGETRDLRVCVQNVINVGDLMRNNWTSGWFGPKPFSKSCEHMDRVPTPLGSHCLYCHEEIVQGDEGYMSHMVYRGGAVGAEPTHMECMVRQVIGSVAHMQRRCSCYVKGSTANDPEGMSLRQAAKAAVELFQKLPETS